MADHLNRLQRILFYTFQELPLFYGISLISSPSYTKDDGGLRADQKWNTTIGVLTKIHCWTRTDICLLCGILPCDFWQLSLACVCAKNERSVITRFVIHILPSSNPNGTDTWQQSEILYSIRFCWRQAILM